MDKFFARGELKGKQFVKGQSVLADGIPAIYVGAIPAALGLHCVSLREGFWVDNKKSFITMIVCHIDHIKASVSLE